MRGTTIAIRIRAAKNVAVMFLALTSALVVRAGTDGNEFIFREKILPILQANCAGCHGAATPSSGLLITKWESLLTGGKHGSAILPGDAQHSLLIQYLRGEKAPRMPLGGSLSDALIAKIGAAIGEMKPEVQKPRNQYGEWLFQKPKLPAIPAVNQTDWVKNPIDAFVLAKLESKGLHPAPPADRRTLIRRAYFDLLGLPPSPEEITSFTNDSSPDAWEKLIDRLLADKRYGERWARHWLDLARFAESDGFAIDKERPTAWRYRDYVIRCFNQDKPYDQFIKEQLAGDELYTKPEQQAEGYVALGFLRMTPWEDDANSRLQLRQDLLNDITGTVGQVFLGLTIGCARCHNHKYDPIPQRDFYRLEAFFAGMAPENRRVDFLTGENPQMLRRFSRQNEDELETAPEILKKLQASLKQKYCEAKNLKLDDKAAGDYTKALADEKDPIFTAEDRSTYKTAKDRLKRLTDALPRYQPVAFSVADVVAPRVAAISDTYVLNGGDLASRGEKVEPGFPECVMGKSEPAKIPMVDDERSSGRRLALAEWIANTDNPMTARVMVNRIWQHHFGEGLVRTPSDFGLNGDRPSHPELLDWLALQFEDKKWSIKAMHKLILSSNTYQESSENQEMDAYAKVDPNNALLWRMNWRRLDAEVIRDSILSVSGRLQASNGGPGAFFNVPPDVAEGFQSFSWFPSDEKEQLRRTVYLFQRRSMMAPMVEVFDGANMNESCASRNTTTVAPQALTLLNGELTNREGRYFAARVIEKVGPLDHDKQVNEAFWLALGRPPSVKEQEKARELFGKVDSTLALTRLGVILFNLGEFVFVN